MDQEKLAEARTFMEGKSTAELLQAYQLREHSTWSPEAIEAMRQLLRERGVKRFTPLPPYKYSALRGCILALSATVILYILVFPPLLAVMDDEIPGFGYIRRVAPAGRDKPTQLKPVPRDSSEKMEWYTYGKANAYIAFKTDVSRILAECSFVFAVSAWLCILTLRRPAVSEI